MTSSKKRVLIIGNGGREHALAWRLSKSSNVDQVFTTPDSPTPFSCGPEIATLHSVDQVVSFCHSHKIDLIVIGPEKYICEGWTEALEQFCPVFAPSQAAGHIESSKSFAKAFMEANDIPTADYGSFTSLESAEGFIDKVKTRYSRFVVKEDGLCAGKGVYILDTPEEALRTIQLLNPTDEKRIVIEEFLDGYEISAMCFTDGTEVRCMPFSQDHKRIGEGNTGENTGGMGAVAPIIVTDNLRQQIGSILQRTVDGLRALGTPFKGVLYAGLMITPTGPKVLEYNCRFGDPETQVLMRLLRSDLYDICIASATGTLAKLPTMDWSVDVAIGIVVASYGYPNSFETMHTVSNVRPDSETTVTFFAGVKRHGNDIVNCGGRVLCVTGTASTIDEAKRDVLEVIKAIDFSIKYYRRDIGHFLVRKSKPLTYAKAGVDIDEADRLIDAIKPACRATLREGLEDIGGFGALVDLQKLGYKSPQLVIGMDGVGTKIEIATKQCDLSNIGYDLVGMCVNDVLCHGAVPIAFLDYYVTGKLNAAHAAAVIKSVAEACHACGCALVGGETAEMPAVYLEHQWDIAGCCIGVRETASRKLPDLEAMVGGDVIIGVASNGVHTNGFSLVRKVLEQSGFELSDKVPLEEKTLGEILLQPTQLYVQALASLLGKVKGLAHITGGGLPGNVIRSIPKHLSAHIDAASWNIPPIFKFLRAAANIQPSEMLRTLNCGIGMTLIVDKADALDVLYEIRSSGLEANQIGYLESARGEPHRVKIANDRALRDASFGHHLINPKKKLCVAVLISGKGSNMIRLIEKADAPQSSVTIRVVISNRTDARGLEEARKRGVPAVCIPHGSDRHVFESQVHQVLQAYKVDFVCCAGFMRILTPEFINKWEDRIINIHPSLLPSFKGAHAVRDALAAKVKVAGCTVHLVTAEIDAGRIIEQAVCRVNDNDTIESLHAKIQKLEYNIYPVAMEKMATIVKNIKKN